MREQGGVRENAVHRDDTSSSAISSAPGAEQAANVNELCDVICVVVGEHQGFAQDGLAVAPWNFGEQICPWIADQFLHFFQVGAELVHAFRPGSGIGGRGGFRPVSLGPFWRDMFRIAAEFEDVPLGDAKVLEDHPGRMREVIWLLAAQVGWKIFDRVIKSGVSVSAGEESDEIFAERLVRVWGHGFSVTRDGFAQDRKDAKREIPRAAGERRGASG